MMLEVVMCYAAEMLSLGPMHETKHSDSVSQKTAWSNHVHQQQLLCKRLIHSVCITKLML